MIYALVKDGVAENVIVLGDPNDYPLPEGYLLIPANGIEPGWVWDGEAFSPPPPPPRDMPDISDRQFFQALATTPYSAITGVTMAEAKAAVKIGQLPASIQAVIDAIEDEAERDRADMLLSGATTFQRYHPEVARFAAVLGWGDAETDAFWLFAAGL